MNATEQNTICKKASKDFDDYNIAVKEHSIKIDDQTMVVLEMRAGVIKNNGTEMFGSFDEMKKNLTADAVITTKTI